MVYEGIYKFVHELEEKVEQGQDIDIKACAAQVEDAFEEMCAQAMVLMMHESLKELYHGDVGQMRAAVDELLLGGVAKNTREKTAKAMINIFRELTGETK